MNFRRLLFSGLFLSFCATSHAELHISLVKERKNGGKALLTYSVKNSYEKGLKSFKAMVLFKDRNGKLVDVKTAWIYGGGKEKKGIVKAQETVKINKLFTVKKDFTTIELIPSRVILEDGSVIMPKVKILPDGGKEKPAQGK